MTSDRFFMNHYAHRDKATLSIAFPRSLFIGLFSVSKSSSQLRSMVNTILIVKLILTIYYFSTICVAIEAQR